MSFYVSRIEIAEKEENHVVQFIEQLRLLDANLKIDAIDLTFEKNSFDVDLCEDSRITAPIPMICFLSDRQLEIFFYWKIFSRHEGVDYLCNQIQDMYHKMEIVAFKHRAQLIADLWDHFAKSETFSSLILTNPSRIMIMFKELLSSRVLLEKAEETVSRNSEIQSYLKTLSDEDISLFFDLLLLPAENNIFNLTEQDFVKVVVELIQKNFVNNHQIQKS